MSPFLYAVDLHNNYNSELLATTKSLRYSSPAAGALPETGYQLTDYYCCYVLSPAAAG